MGIGAWIVSAQKPPERKLALVTQPLTTSKHFTGKVQFDVLAKLLADDRRSAPSGEWLRELADPKAPFRVKTQVHPLLEHAAPDFTLEDHRGQRWSLQGQHGRVPVVLVFYLGYLCNACVHDLFELNADLDRFRSLGAEVVAVSGDSPTLTRQRFEQYGAFGFPVLSDPGHVAALSYGTFRPAKTSEPEELLHGTFLISRNGQVCWVSFGDTPFRNNKSLLYEVALLENKLPQPEPNIGAAGRGSK
jgi:peroxiredoxin